MDHLRAFEPTIVCRTFKFEGHEPTKALTFTGPVVLTDDGIILIPTSKQSANSGLLIHFLGLIGALIAYFSRGVKKVEWPFESYPYGSVARALQTVQNLRNFGHDQRVMLVHKADIVGYSSSFWKGLKVICRNRVTIIPGNRKMAKHLPLLGYVDLTRK